MVFIPSNTSFGLVVSEEKFFTVSANQKQELAMVADRTRQNEDFLLKSSQTSYPTKSG